MSSKLFVRLRPNGKTRGPYSRRQLAGFAAAGQITGSTEVSPDGTSWVAYEDLNRDAVQDAPPAEPSPPLTPQVATQPSPPVVTHLASPGADHPTAQAAADSAPPPTLDVSSTDRGPMRAVAPADPKLPLKNIATLAVSVGRSLTKTAVKAKQTIDSKADEAAVRMGRRSEDEPYSVFISYRRGGGAEVARWLAEKLEQQGYRAFLDVDGLHEGDWHEGLQQAITQCPNFVVVVTDGFFDRCVQDDDVVRKELAWALSESKNVVPLIVTDNPFPEDLPADIQPVSRMNGVRYRHEHAANAITQLCSMLQGDSSWRKLERGDPQPLRVLTVVAALIGLLQGIQVFNFSGMGSNLMSLSFLPMMLASLVFLTVVELTPIALLVHTLVIAFLGRSQEQYYGGKRWCVFWLTYSPVITIPSLLVSVVGTLVGAFLLGVLGFKESGYGHHANTLPSMVRLVMLFLLSFGLAIGTALIVSRIVIKSGAWMLVKRTFSILK